jgi:hypothetical protein
VRKGDGCTERERERKGKRGEAGAEGGMERGNIVEIGVDRALWRKRYFESIRNDIA